MIGLLAALLAGATLSSGRYALLTGDDRVAWVWVTALCLSPVLIIAGAMMRALRGAVRGSRKRIDAARAAGRVGIARIDGLRQTNTEINNQPLCELVDAF